MFPPMTQDGGDIVEFGHGFLGVVRVNDGEREFAGFEDVGG